MLWLIFDNVDSHNFASNSQKMTEIGCIEQINQKCTIYIFFIFDSTNYVILYEVVLTLVFLQVDPKFLRNMRFSKKHNKKGNAQKTET